MTIQINKREFLLTVERTEFKELRMIYDELKPICDLWTLANKFNKSFPGNFICFYFVIVWFEGKFESLDSDVIDENVNEWVNDLKRLNKNSVIIDSPK
jgi:hypothetical protein